MKDLVTGVCDTQGCWYGCIWTNFSRWDNALELFCSKINIFHSCFTVARTLTFLIVSEGWDNEILQNAQGLCCSKINIFHSCFTVARTLTFVIVSEGECKNLLTLIRILLENAMRLTNDNPSWGILRMLQYLLHGEITMKLCQCVLKPKEILKPATSGSILVSRVF